MRGARQGQWFAEDANAVSNVIAFMKSCGVPCNAQNIRQAEVYVSHESLLPPYEQALSRQDPETGKYCAALRHFSCLGYLKRQPNPISIKCGSTLSSSDLLDLLDILNPGLRFLHASERARFVTIWRE